VDPDQRRARHAVGEAGQSGAAERGFAGRQALLERADPAAVRQDLVPGQRKRGRHQPGIGLFIWRAS
jgi:hypothetical protein